VHAPSVDADELQVDSKDSAEREPRRHALYGELFGTGGLYALGYDYRWRPRLGVGVTVSAYKFDGERVLSLSPYVAVYPLVRGHHSLFAQTGPKLIDRKLDSPVPLWDGVHSTSVGAQLSTGYEYRNRILVRAFVMAVAGKGGVAPWGGASLGFTF
jgi:hypothetical protein